MTVTTKTVTVTGVLGVSSSVPITFYLCPSVMIDFSTPIGLALYGHASMDVFLVKTDLFGKRITFHFTNRL
jgi:hypothetical protein